MDLWPWIVAACAVGVVLFGMRRRPAADEPDEPADVPAVPPTRWTPYDHPMGPVSGWPHLVDRPEEVPSRSPTDRAFVVD
ncbi:MAG: hypothetical protein FWH11_13900 [Micrococcales bacterium]|nr:hypothetical protein [Micrococcales bacterium]